MLNKKSISTILALIMTMTILATGCGSSSYNSSSSNASYDSGMYTEDVKMQMEEDGIASPEMSMVDGVSMGSNDTAPTSGEKTVATQPKTPRKVIKNVYLQLESMLFDDGVVGIEKMVTDAGGYLDSKNVEGKSLRDHNEYSERGASLVARIPVEELDAFLDSVGTLCNVVHKNESAQDISQQYYDTQRRLEVLKAQEDKLLELLEKSEDLESLITLEARLAECRYEIETIDANIRNMDQKVSYSTVNIDLREVVEYKEEVLTPKNFGDKLSNAFEESFENMGRSLENTLFSIIRNGPVLLFRLGLFLLCIYIVIKVVFAVKKRIERKQAIAQIAAKNIDQMGNDIFTSEDKNE